MSERLRMFSRQTCQKLTRRFIAQLGELAAAPPQRCFLFGQSVPGSCRGLAFGLLAHALRRLSTVTLRDEASWRKLRAAGAREDLIRTVRGRGYVLEDRAA